MEKAHGKSNIPNNKPQFSSKVRKNSKAKFFYKKLAQNNIGVSSSDDNMSGGFTKSYGGGANRRPDFSRKRKNLEVGMKGFLCTCNIHERDCVREAYNILNEYYEDSQEKGAESVGERNENLTTETETDAVGAASTLSTELKVIDQVMYVH